MRNRRRNLLLAGLVALALVGVVVWLALPPREPVYKGKTLSEWFSHDFDLDDDSDWSFSTNGMFDTGTGHAISHFGTNAVPTLLQMLRAHDSKLKLELVRLAEKQPLVKFHFVPADARNLEAALGFYVLGAAASNAVPDLIQVLDEKVSAYSEAEAICSLGYIGPAARATAPKLLSIVGNTNADLGARISAAQALVQVQANPGLVVPALMKCLKDSDSDVRVQAASALGQLGSAAKAAVPALVTLLNDPKYSVRLNAGDALKAIDPEAAAKAGVK
jgi:HEAT repeat protein